MEPLEKLDDDFDLDSDCDLQAIDSDDSDNEFSADLLQRLRGFGTQLPSIQRARQENAAEDEFERKVNAELAASMAAYCRKMAPSSALAVAAPSAPSALSVPAGCGGAGSSWQPGADPNTVSNTERNTEPNTEANAVLNTEPNTEANTEPNTEAKAEPNAQSQSAEPRYYDDMYFDSDDDSLPEEGAPGQSAESADAASRPAGATGGAAEGAAEGAAGDAANSVADGAGLPGGPSAPTASGRSARRRRRRPVLSDDQLLYDPAMDEDDQLWVDRQRRKYLPTPAGSSGSGDLSSKPQKLPHSDAVLNCPACMTMVCLDCQRHELYSNQYRAMFVFNCEVDESQGLRYRLKQSGRRRSGFSQRAAADAAAGDGDGDVGAHELYHPVKCAACKTEVAVYDGDEVYHFFNVIASHS